MPGLVATSEIHAARAAAAVLADGGSAVDAAVCAAACLTVTEPTSNGLGGDLFALVHDGAAVHALASSGASPARLVRADIDGDRMPLTGWLPVTVPGQVAGWVSLLERFGRLGRERVLAPAVRLAEDGFPVGPITAAAWRRAAPRFRHFEEWSRVFLHNGEPPAAGERFRNPDLGRSLARIAAGGHDAFYGELGRVVAAHAAATGGMLEEGDFAAHRAVWEEPLEVRYRGVRVLGMSAPTQGVVALEALGLLAPVPDEGVHDQIEAIKLAFADAYASVADPAWLRVPPASLLRPAFLRERRRSLHRDRAGPSPAPSGIDGGTVLVCVGDADGGLCSLIQSNFHGFGSGIVVPGTGVALQNRGAGFVLDEDHPNRVAGGKRPFHTILPGLILDQGGAGLAAFGCMGGQMQPQGHVQLVSALRRGLSPQQAIDTPRWRWLDQGRLALERGFSTELRRGLARLGHAIDADVDPAEFGGAQIVLRGPDGLVGGSDRRKDGGVVSG
jgi:gamma-glutamyltranspeptidase/glutathione hydrolase